MQWIVGALTNDPEQLARFAGFAKGCLAGGLACSFGIDAAGVSQLSVVAFNFTIQAVGLVCMVVVCWLAVKPTNYLLEESVIPPANLEAAKGSDLDQTVYREEKSSTKLKETESGAPK